MNNGIIAFPQPHAYESEEQLYAVSTAFTFSLPLSRKPDSYRMVLVCKTANNSYAVSDETDLALTMRVTGEHCGVTINGGKISVTTGAIFAVTDMVSGARVLGVAANWALKVYAVWMLP